MSYSFADTGLYILRFIPKYFILFDAMVNGVVVLISLSDSSLLAYRNATDLYIFVLYFAILSDSLMSSCSFWWSL